MRFGQLPIEEAVGGVVAHAVRQGDLVLKKGTVVTAAHVAVLRAAGIGRITVAKTDPQDVAENDAAALLAGRAAGVHVRVDPPFTGRSNLFATEAGVLIVDAAAVDRVNAIDEALTIATLPALKAVTAGEMVATVKVIPFAVESGLLDRALAEAAGAVRVAPFRPRRIGVVSTLLPGLKPAVVDKTIRVMEDRLRPAGATIASERRVPHEVEPLRAALAAEIAGGAELVVVFGASAITDRRDVIPAAIEAAGGRVEHFGMPVDPGNLMLIGRIGDMRVIGAPGCARSPKENGFDWVLQRLLADLPVGRDELIRMGVGGLLMEIVSRPQPRAPAADDAVPVAAIVLAAGRSTRMGGPNKLTLDVRGKPMVRHAAEAALGSRARPVIVVTGHDAGAVERALAGLDVVFRHNPDFVRGLSGSLRTGIAAVPAGAAAAVVLLGDMPGVTAGTVDRLIEGLAARPTALAVAPVVDGRRGNPILLARRLFPAVAALDGDTGARRLLDLAGEDVAEVAIDDAAVLTDVDTPEALSALRMAGF